MKTDNSNIVVESLEKKAEKYAESAQYDLEIHDEGGYVGIDERALAKHLISFHKEQLQPLIDSHRELLDAINLLYPLVNIVTYSEKHKVENKLSIATKAIEKANNIINSLKV